MKKRRFSFWSWFVVALGAGYFLVPLIATFVFSLKENIKGLSFVAYQNVFNDPRFWKNFSASVLWSILTILIGLLVFVPTAFWVRIRLPKLRVIIEYITLLPFVVPAIVFVFGLVQTYSHPPLMIVSSPLLLVFAYSILSMPYMYRAVDTGLRSIDVATLTEAAQSLGAGWSTILLRVIVPNIRVSLLSGAFLTFAIVMGEFTLAEWLAKPAFGPYMQYINQMRAYEPAACAVLSFALTWGAMGIMQRIGKGGEQGQIAGVH